MIEINKNIPVNTPLYQLQDFLGVSNVYVKDESKNPTHTFKDRLACEMVMPLYEKFIKKEKLSKTTFCSISYGNTAYSMGYYCELLNKAVGYELTNTIVIIPNKFSDKVFGADTEGKIVSSETVITKLSKFCYIIEYDLENEILDSDKIISLVKKSGYSFDIVIDVTEGLNRPAYQPIISEIIEYQLEIVPDYIIVPFGAGILCNEIIDYIKNKKLKSKVIPVSTGNPHSIATMLYGPIWVDTKSLLESGKGFTKHNPVDKKGNRRDPYLVYSISDYNIIQTTEQLKEYQFSCEPSAVSGFAILKELKEIDFNFNPAIHSVLIINTGNGLLNYESDFVSNDEQIKNTLTIETNIEYYVTEINKNIAKFDLELIRKMHPSIKDDILQITTIQAQFFNFLLKTLNPILLIDIGTYKGYSATCMALNTPNDALIYTLENNEEYLKEANDFFSIFNIEHKIISMYGQAENSLKLLSESENCGKFDFIFLDADKDLYIEYYDLSIKLLKSGGVLAIDNTLLFGTIVDKEVSNKSLSKYATKNGIQAIKNLNKKIKTDGRVEYCLLPISDGLTLVTKK